jgi:hypothetical protein
MMEQEEGPCTCTSENAVECIATQKGLKFYQAMGEGLVCDCLCHMHSDEQAVADFQRFLIETAAAGIIPPKTGRSGTDYIILDIRWFSNGTTFRYTRDEEVSIGVVAIKSNMHEPDGPLEWVAYIGLCKEHSEQLIAGLGTKLLAKEAQGFFPSLPIEQYKVDKRLF